MDDLMKQATDALYEKMFAKAQREVGDAVILLSIQAYLREHPEHVRRFPEPSYVPNELYDQAYKHILGVDPIVRDKVLKFHAGFSSTFILPLEGPGSSAYRGVEGV